jgi:DNA repair ATPase RecN
VIENIVERLEAVLADLDALSEEYGSPEGLEDLNAELEDALMMLSEIDSRDAGWEEELSDALEEIRALAGDYRKVGIPAAKALGDRLEQAAGE